MSIAIGAASFALAAWLVVKKGDPVFGRRPLLFWYFGAMEFLQVWQYAVADQCENPTNQALTYVAYMHIAFQPLIVNYYFWGGFKESKPDLVKFILRLCFAGGMMMLFRLPGMPMGMLGDKLGKFFPDLPDSTMYGKACHHLESNCGPKLCSLTGGGWGHISWSVPLLPATYFVPSGFLHAFLFFMPTLLGASDMRRYLMLLDLAFGPTFAMYNTRKDMETYALEWPTIWCFFAAVQCMIGIAIELWKPEVFQGPAAPKAIKADGTTRGRAKAA